MGLDMTIDRKTGYDSEMKPTYSVYHSWERANQIHGWFEKRFDTIENTVHYPLSVEILSDLLLDCIAVLYYRDFDDACLDQESTMRATKLPPTSGFFFGSTEYNEWYYDDIQDTIDCIKEIFRTMSEEEVNDLAYWAWW